MVICDSALSLDIFMKNYSTFADVPIESTYFVQLRVLDGSVNLKFLFDAKDYLADIFMTQQ